MTEKLWRRVEINGGRVEGERPERFFLPGGAIGYADAQIDDYLLPDASGRPARFRRRPGVRLSLRARFSHPEDRLLGTAGFGFWNAPFGDPSAGRPALPQAAWFFFASAPSDLPLAAEGPGRGWFAATIDAGSVAALSIAPLALPVLLLNHWPGARRRLWPWTQERLGISFAPLGVEMTGRHLYRLDWRPEGCVFQVDGRDALRTAHSPRGPLCFVCWLDNQYLVLTPRGRLRWGALDVADDQWLEIDDLTLGAL